MKVGDKVQVSIEGSEWVEGKIVLASENKKSLGICLFEAVRLPTAERRGFCLTMLLALLKEDDEYVCVVGGSKVKLKPNDTAATS